MGIGWVKKMGWRESLGKEQPGTRDPIPGFMFMFMFWSLVLEKVVTLGTYLEQGNCAFREMGGI